MEEEEEVKNYRGKNGKKDIGKGHGTNSRGKPETIDSPPRNSKAD